MRQSTCLAMAAIGASIALMSSAAVLADMEGENALSNTAGVVASGACTMVDFETPDAKTAYSAMPFRRPRAKIVREFATSGGTSRRPFSGSSFFRIAKYS